jgi:predicted SnoaL-like aldol condensation-catalyzing enzyme
MRRATFITAASLLALAACQTTASGGGVQAASLAPPPGPTTPGEPVAVAAHPDPLSLLSSDDPALEANKRLVFDVWRQIVDAGREELAGIYLDPDYIQHNPNAATGRDGFKAYFSRREDRPIETSLRAPLVALLAEGDLVVQVVRFEEPNPYTPGETYTTAWFDMFRIADGRLVEHWDAARKPGAVVEEFGVSCDAPLQE